MKNVTTKHAALIAILFTALLAGCSSRQAESILREENPESEVMRIPGEKYEFLMREEDGRVYHVTYRAFDKKEGTAASNKVLIFE